MFGDVGFHLKSLPMQHKISIKKKNCQVSEADSLYLCQISRPT